MQLAKSFEQAACVLVLLATQQPEIPLTADVLHERIGGSASYIRKIIRKLVVAGLVTSTSGNNGGVHLARSPEDISITDVVAAIEGTLQTFPNYGYFDRVFKDVEPVAHVRDESGQRDFFASGSIMVRFFRPAKTGDVDQGIISCYSNPSVGLDELLR
ncbi:RrF2 family transcriptional regulator [Lactiplantibacillus plantarum]|uniref:RrF2 family transcriptional regulator n=1 Tax=Lactiplantibacillus plantarum TaxID=1590 RepID=UPI0035D62968